MNETNTEVGGFGTQNQGSNFVAPAAKAASVTPSVAPAVYHPTTSTMKASELAALDVALQAGNPMLLPPHMVIANLRLQIIEIESKIISDICKSMSKSAQEMSEQNKEAYIKSVTVDAAKGGPKSGAEYLFYLMSIPSSQKEKELEGPTESEFQRTLDQTLNTWLVNPISMTGNIATDGYPSVAFIAGSLIGGIGTIDASSASFGKVSVSPVADALAGGLGQASGLPGDYQLAAGLVAALLYQGAFNKAASMTMQAATTGSKPPQDLDFALNFASQVLSIIAPNIESTAQLDPKKFNPKVNAQNNLIRLMLGTVALNMVYRIGYGGMTGVDLRSLLQGNTQDLPDAIRGTVESLVAEINKYMPEDPTAHESLLSQLAEYVDSQESVDSMLQTKSMLGDLMRGVSPPMGQV
ncbi:MAG: hypothetical protein WCF65_04410 [Parachlamydiaceae bacterium]